MQAESSPGLVGITHTSGLPCHPCGKQGSPFAGEHFFQANPKSVAEQQPKAKQRREGYLGDVGAAPAPHPAGSPRCSQAHLGRQREVRHPPPRR